MPGQCNIYDGYLDDDLSSTGTAIYNTQKLIDLKNGQGHTFSDDTWYPVFIDTGTNAVSSSVMSSHGVIQSTRLGIAGFISFSPTFNNWNTDGSMDIDWILNNHLIPYPVYYGLMFWFKQSSGGFLDGGNIWIPDGDAFAFERSTSERTTFNSNGIAHRTYVGMGIYKYYTSIHNVLTLDETKSTSKQLKRTRIFKAIAAYLATSPFVSEFYLHALDSGTVKGYINTAINSNGTMSDISTCLVNISTHMKSLGLDNKENQQTLTNNYITTNSDLYTKCKNKYGANLYLSNGQYLEYKDNLPNNANFECYEYRDNLVPSSVTNSKIFVNQTIDTGFLKVQSSLNATNTSLIFSGGGSSLDIPLAELAKPNLGSLEIRATLQKNTDDISYTGIESYIPIYDVNNDYLFYVLANSNGDIKNTTGDINSVATDIHMSLEPFKNTPNDFFIREPIDYKMSSMFQFKWEIVSGCANFVGRYDTRSGYPNIGSVANESHPTVAVNKLGPIKIRITVNSPMGTVSKIKTIYVVSAGQQAVDALLNPNKRFNALQQGTYKDSDGNIVNPPAPGAYELESVNLSANGNMVSSCNMTRYAFSNEGVFWPIYTDMHIISNPTTKPVPVEPLSRNFKFHLDQKNKTQAGRYKISFQTTHGAFVRISRITLNCARSSDDNYSDCFSVCQPRLQKIGVGRIAYSDTHLAGHTLYKVEGEIGNTTKLGDSVDFEPGIPATDNAPTVYAYGGYTAAQKNNLGIPDLPDHPDPGSAVNSNNVTQFELLHPVDTEGTAEEGKEYKICYPKALGAHGPVIDFTKGVFDPTIGWSYGANNNKTSVLKFKPGCRDTLSFIGPGLSQFECDYSDDGLSTVSKSYRASISLAIDEAIRPEAFSPGCNASPNDAMEYDKFQHELAENTRKRAADQENGRNTHGYRILNQGIPKRTEQDEDSAQVGVFQSDEFRFEPQAGQASCTTDDPTAIDKTFNYYFIKLGAEGSRLVERPSFYDITSFEEYQTYVESNGKPDPNLYDTRYISATVNDIEVKLNLLNILNTKDFAIKLKVTHDANTSRSFFPPRAQKPSAPVGKRANKFIDSSSQAIRAYDDYGDYFSGGDTIQSFIDTIVDNDLSDYCAELIRFNSIKSTTQQVLYLMNQEHYSHNTFNTNLVFSDHASKNNVLYNHNRYNPYAVNPYQNIVKSVDYKLLPTMATDGYSERDHIYYRHLIANNNIGIANNTFSKFHGVGFFQRYNDRECKIEYDSSITFTLEIEVVDEPDLMGAYENTRDGPYLAGYYNSYNKPTSNNPFNSICNWELVLHNGNVPKMAPHTTSTTQSMNNSDALGLIEYGNSPRYEGYNFIADFTGKKYLLPTVNMDAPNVYMDDLTLCNTSSDYEAFAKQVTAAAPEFPWAAIMRILVAYAGVGLRGSLAGTLAFLGFTGFDFSAIIEFLGSLSQAERVGIADRNIYAMDFSKYYTGSPEKILLNVSKDGGIWYKLEASIFKLSNTPALPQNQYHYALMKKGNFPLFTDIYFNNVASIKELINDAFIIELTLSSSDLTNTSGYDINSALTTGTVSFNDINLQSGDIISLRVIGINNFDGLYIVNDSDWTLLEPDDIENISNYTVNPSAIYDSKKFLSINSIFAIGRDLFSGFRTNINDGKIIIVDNEYCFNIFDIGDTIIAYYGSGGSSGNSKVCNISNKGKVFKDGIIKTVLVVDEDITEYDRISPYFGESDSSGDHKAIIFKSGETVTNGERVPFQRWSLEKNGIPETVPVIEQSAIGRGSVGDGSFTVNKSFFTNTLKHNKIDNLDQLLNNHESMRVKYNSLTFIKEDKTTTSSTGAIKGYKVSYDDTRKTFTNNIIFDNNFDDKDKQDVLNQINITDANRNNYSMIMVSFPAEPMEEQVGRVVIDQDFEYKPVKSIASGDLSIIENRITDLEDNIIPGLESNYSSAEADDPECHFANPSVNCPKKSAQDALYARYHERAKLIAVTGEVTANVLGATNIKVTTNSDGSVSLDEENIGDNYYWINIDADQFCSVADDMTPKILVRTKVDCLTTSRAGLVVQIPIYVDNSMCPGYLADGTSLKEGPNKESLNGNIGSSVYEFDEADIDSIKSTLENQYSSIAGWETKSRTRIVYVYGPSLDTRTNYYSNILRIEETYYVAIPAEDTITSGWDNDSRFYNDHTIDIDSTIGGTDELGYIGRKGKPGKVINIFNLDTTGTLKVSFRKIPRLVRGRDTYGTVQRLVMADRFTNPGESTSFGGGVDSGSLLPQDLAAGGGFLFSDIYAWYCFRKDKATGKLMPETVPDYFKLLNEMELRAFYGSTDGTEIKNQDIIECLNAEEMIPFEFGGNPDNIQNK
jgi:hypothetical protein